MARLAIAYVSFKRLGIWKKFDLDVILTNGDQLYESSDRTDYLSVTDLPETFQVGYVQGNVEENINRYGTLRNGTVSAEELSEIFRSVTNELQENRVLFFAQGFCFAIFFWNHSFCIFDSHSRNSVRSQISNYMRSFSFSQFSLVMII